MQGILLTKLELKKLALNVREILSERGKSYGKYTDVVKRWQDYLINLQVPTHEINELEALELVQDMVALKLSRLDNSYQEDSIKDIFGYLILYRDFYPNDYDVFSEYLVNTIGEYKGTLKGLKTLVEILQVMDEIE